MAINFTCIIVDDEQHAIELIKGKLAHLYKNITITGAFTDWEDALDALRGDPPDLLLMDISMPGKNAFDLLKLLPNRDSEIVFVTAHENFALDAFAVLASGYLLKPVDDAEFCTAIDKALDRIKNKKLARQNLGPAHELSDKIGIPNNHGIDYISINDILYLESTNKCTKIVTAKTEFTSSLNLGKFQYLVDRSHFFQAHRSFIININFILRYETSGVVIMSDKKEIPVSRYVKNDFLKLFPGSY